MTMDAQPHLLFIFCALQALVQAYVKKKGPYQGKIPGKSDKLQNNMVLSTELIM